jgi:hypothetical protein
MAARFALDGAPVPARYRLAVLALLEARAATLRGQLEAWGWLEPAA